MKRYLGKKKVLRIYFDNSDRYENEPLWEVLLKSIKEFGLAGATILKASAGIGVNTELHTFEIWSLSQKLPVVLEVIDDEDKILEFLKRYDYLIKEGLVTLSDVEVLRYKNASKD